MVDVALAPSTTVPLPHRELFVTDVGAAGVILIVKVANAEFRAG